MVESNIPLLQHSKKLTCTTSYQTLLKIRADPNKTIHVDTIVIDFSSIAGTPYIYLAINGEPLLRDFEPLNVQTKLGFGGDLVFHGKGQKPPILIKVKDGTATPTVTAFVTGVQVPYTPR